MKQVQEIHGKETKSESKIGTKEKESKKRKVTKYALIVKTYLSF